VAGKFHLSERAAALHLTRLAGRGLIAPNDPSRRPGAAAITSRCAAAIACTGTSCTARRARDQQVEVLRFIADVGDRGDSVARIQLIKRFDLDKAAVRWLDRLWADKLISRRWRGSARSPAWAARRFVMTARGSIA